MESTHGLPGWQQIVVLLLAAGILVPLLHRFRIPPVLGYLVVGGLVGPFGLGLWVASFPLLTYVVITDLEVVKGVAELGVIFLLFMIGLDLSLDRLWGMRRLVFGMGSLQVLITAGLIGVTAYQFGNSVSASVILGACLALSSTAVVMQLLIERQQMSTLLGRTSFAVLLLQDLAVVPLLFLVSFLSRPGDEGLGLELAMSLGQAAVVIGCMYLLGRILLRPLFHMVALSRSVEMFVALTLLIVLLAASATGSFGLSMALGGFLAGMLLAETEFRHEIEVTMEPFKGLLLGLFFMSVGMGIDYRIVGEHLGWLLGSVAGLFLMKATVVFALGVLFKVPKPTAMEAGLLLGQGGEFAFVVVGLAMAGGILPKETGYFMLIVTGMSMMLTPFVAALGRKLAVHWETRAHTDEKHLEDNLPVDLQGHVIITGFGRVGRSLVRLLDTEGIPYVALDKHANVVSHYFQAGMPVFYGDASRVEMLKKLHIDRALALVITMDNPSGAERVVGVVRAHWPLLPVFARARDAEHALRLRRLGATDVVPETVEASLQLASRVLTSVGVSEEVARHRIDIERAWQMQHTKS